LVTFIFCLFTLNIRSHKQYKLVCFVHSFPPNSRKCIWYRKSR
jgi:hypothetical protein